MKRECRGMRIKFFLLSGGKASVEGNYFLALGECVSYVCTDLTIFLVILKCVCVKVQMRLG